MSNLRQAAQQALEVLEQLQGGCTDSDDGTVEAITVWCPEVIDALRAALAELDLDHCPKCGGPADNGHDRCIPPNPYFCSKCTAEPEQEPDYWQEEARRYAGNADYWRKRYEALAEPERSKLRMA